MLRQGKKAEMNKLVWGCVVNITDRPNVSVIWKSGSLDSITRFFMVDGVVLCRGVEFPLNADVLQLELFLCLSYVFLFMLVDSNELNSKLTLSPLSLSFLSQQEDNLTWLLATSRNEQTTRNF